jgi:hypothetical protein
MEFLIPSLIYFPGLFVAFMILGYKESKRIDYIINGELLCVFWPLVIMYFVAKWLFTLPRSLGEKFNLARLESSSRKS